MRITASYMNTVVFLCIDEDVSPGVRDRVAKASAFFVLAGERYQHVYVVTARHCIEETLGRTFYVRYNGPNGIVDLPTHADDWYTHDSADVAAALFITDEQPEPVNPSAMGLEQFVGADYTVNPRPIFGPSAGANYSTAELDPTTNTLTPTDRIAVEVGEQVFFVSLFVPHAGATKNLPVVRFGHISRMPDEPITFERSDGSKVDLLGYLAECHSWGGHSGAPVFWWYPRLHLFEVDAPPTFEVKGKIAVPVPEAGLIALLGLVSGHFDIKRPDEVKGDFEGSVTSAINAGIAVVTPADAIRELLMREDVVSDRKKREDDAAAQAPAATFDSGFQTQDDRSEFDRFEDLTRQLVHTPKPKPDEKADG